MGTFYEISTWYSGVTFQKLQDFIQWTWHLARVYLHSSLKCEL